MVVDITEHKQLEARLRQTAKMEAIGQLAGGIAHDFNNQLTAIIGFGELAIESLDADHPAREHVEQVQLAGEKAASLTRQILAFGRRQVLQPRILSLNTVLRGCEKMLRRIVSENIELVFHQGKGLRPVKIDPWQMEQVIMNLAINARDSRRRTSISTRNTLLPTRECSRARTSWPR
jgi:signal transduction histidine kinase